MLTYCHDNKTMNLGDVATVFICMWYEGTILSTTYMDRLTIIVVLCGLSQEEDLYTSDKSHTHTHPTCSVVVCVRERVKETPNFYVKL